MNINKTILIAGSASVVSLAVGGAGGYFICKKRFESFYGAVVDREVAAVTKYYEMLIAESADEEEAEDEELGKDFGEDDLSEEQIEEALEEDASEAEEPLRKDDEKLRRAAEEALTDYRRISNRIVSQENKPELSKLVEKNIFAERDKTKKDLPPREPGTGRFVGRHQVPEKVQPKENVEKETTPYLISEEEFLANPNDHEQETCLYFAMDDTVILKSENEEVPTGQIGQVNLTLFPKTPKDEPSTIFVRNEALEMEWEIQRTYESLTEYMGLGESEADLDPSAYL